jgi:hypothetical protein
MASVYAVLVTIAVSMAPLAVYGLQEALGWSERFGNAGTVQDFYVWIKGNGQFCYISSGIIPFVRRHNAQNQRPGLICSPFREPRCGVDNHPERPALNNDSISAIINVIDAVELNQAIRGDRHYWSRPCIQGGSPSDAFAVGGPACEHQSRAAQHGPDEREACAFDCRDPGGRKLSQARTPWKERLRDNVRISEINAFWPGRCAWNIAIMVFDESAPVTG